MIPAFSGRAADELKVLLQEHGPNLLNRPELCRNFLKDLCPEEDLEINLLTCALKDKLQVALERRDKTSPDATVISSVSRSFAERNGLDREVATATIYALLFILGDTERPTPPFKPEQAATTVGRESAVWRLKGEQPVGQRAPVAPEVTEECGSVALVGTTRILLSLAIIALLALVIWWLY